MSGATVKAGGREACADGYAAFLRAKAAVTPAVGMPVVPELGGHLFEFQRDIVAWALRRGRAAIFADCGMGKTAMQLEWAAKVPGPVLIVAPLAVAAQTMAEGRKFGVPVRRAKCGSEVTDDCKIWVTNYERLERFDPAAFWGVVLDESSILKSYSGKYRTMLVERWGDRPFRLACTATPAPNDYMELGNHAEFLGCMTGSEMLAAYFINNPSEVGKYRLKGHAERPFWRWLSSWAVMIRKPSDLGYDDEGYRLPPLRIVDVMVDANEAPEGMLFALEAHTMSERRQARAATVAERVAAVADKVNASDEKWIAWCDRNDESARLTASIPDAVEVRGSMPATQKEEALLGFANGDFRVLVSKPSIAGWGMNFQCCRNMAFTGLSDSYEQFYQAVRRCWRFGQTRPVNCYVVTDRTEGKVVANIRRKEEAARRMAEEMAREMAYVSRGEIRADKAFAQKYETAKKMEVPAWLSA